MEFMILFPTTKGNLAVAALLSATTFSSCYQEDGVTREGPDPIAKIAARHFNESEWIRQALEIDICSEEAAQKLYDQYKNEPLRYGPHLEKAIARVQEFHKNGKYFAYKTKLPGGLDVSNDLYPDHALQALEKALSHYNAAKEAYLRGE